MLNMTLFELVNPSDPLTFYAPNLEVAAVVAYSLSSHYGAVSVDNPEERSSILLGWGDWFEERNIDGEWMKANHLVLADAFDSLVIGKPEKRAQFDATLAALSDSQKEAFKKEHHDKNRSSLKDIVSFAHKYAEKCRELHKQEQGKANAI
ncbi:hypothetical protein QPP80_003774 [Vibrio alginolyticus]|nr:hypothetical protein [Vibrio alginolyticus]